MNARRLNVTVTNAERIDINLSAISHLRNMAETFKYEVRITQRQVDLVNARFEAQLRLADRLYNEFATALTNLETDLLAAQAEEINLRSTSPPPEPVSRGPRPFTPRPPSNNAAVIIDGNLFQLRRDSSPEDDEIVLPIPNRPRRRRPRRSRRNSASPTPSPIDTSSTYVDDDLDDVTLSNVTEEPVGSY